MDKNIYMERALFLAEQGRGYTAPNPMVGAVIVRNGHVIGEGYHACAGEKRAEVVAIEAAGTTVSGAEIYSNLEPCCHETPDKRTPPCTRRLIQEGFRKVIIATLDPNPHVSGQGVKALRDAGIDVEVGVLAERAAQLNESFFKFIRTRRPFVHLKIAMTLDGRIATREQDSRWITDEAARRRVHEMRHQHDAVLVGANTVRIDNPRLTVRHVPGKQPLRLVLDSQLNFSQDSHLFCDEYRHLTHVFTSASTASKNGIIQNSGVHLHQMAPDMTNRVDLPALLDTVGEMGITSLLVEGGADVNTAFLRAGFFDKISVFIAPIITGEGISAVGDLNTRRIADALRLQEVRFEGIGSQILLEGYRDILYTRGHLLQETASLDVAE